MLPFTRMTFTLVWPASCCRAQFTCSLSSPSIKKSTWLKGTLSRGLTVSPLRAITLPCMSVIVSFTVNVGSQAKLRYSFAFVSPSTGVGRTACSFTLSVASLRRRSSSPVCSIPFRRFWINASMSCSAGSKTLPQVPRSFAPLPAESISSIMAVSCSRFFTGPPGCVVRYQHGFHS